MGKKHLIKFGIGVSMVLSTLSLVNSYASTSSSTTQAKATLTAFCQVSSTNINLGVLDTTKNNTATGSINVLCTKNTAYNIRVIYENKGQANTQGIMTGIAADGSTIADAVLYSIYKPSPNTSVVWGDTSSTGPTVSATGSGLQQSYTMTAIGFTSMSNGQPGGATYSYITAGSYSANATVSISY